MSGFKLYAEPLHRCVSSAVAGRPVTCTFACIASETQSVVSYQCIAEWETKNRMWETLRALLRCANPFSPKEQMMRVLCTPVSKTATTKPPSNRAHHAETGSYNNAQQLFLRGGLEDEASKLVESASPF